MSAAPASTQQTQQKKTIFEVAEIGDLESLKDLFATSGHLVFENVLYQK